MKWLTHGDEDDEEDEDGGDDEGYGGVGMFGVG